VVIRLLPLLTGKIQIKLQFQMAQLPPQIIQKQIQERFISISIIVEVGYKKHTLRPQMQMQTIGLDIVLQ
jgi:hypothetical protein